MAEQDQEQKTEEPSEKRRQTTREDGRTAKSSDLSFAVMLVAAAGLSLVYSDRVRVAFEALLNPALGTIAHGTTGSEFRLGLITIERAVVAVAPFLITFTVLAVVASFAQIGVYFIPEKLRPRPEKLLPQLSPTKFVNGKSLIETLTSILKLVLLSAAFHAAVRPHVELALTSDALETIVAEADQLIFRLLLYVGLMLLFIGLLDFAMKHRNLEKEMRMTKQEVKQEAKDAQGDPEVKGKIKRRQRQLAYQRMMDAVPEASLVVTNPTHYAVALKYESGMAAPVVLAKGKDLVAQRIKELARLANVPIMENPPLARALHDTTQPGDEVPPHLYQAVAEVLAAVLRTRRRIGRTA